MWKEKLEERIQGQHKTLRHERDSGAQLGIYAEWVERRRHQRAPGGGCKEAMGPYQDSLLWMLAAALLILLMRLECKEVSTLHFILFYFIYYPREEMLEALSLQLRICGQSLS